MKLVLMPIILLTIFYVFSPVVAMEIKEGSQEGMAQEDSLFFDLLCNQKISQRKVLNNKIQLVGMMCNSWPIEMLGALIDCCKSNH